MRAYKCDICGKYFDLGYDGKRKTIDIRTFDCYGAEFKSGRHHYDLCNECVWKIEQLINPSCAPYTEEVSNDA